MWKKTFIRSAIIGLAILATLVVFASATATQTDTDECNPATSAAKEGCEKKAQADFIIWETLGKTIMSSVSY